MARPSKYKPEFAAQAEKLCNLGATDVELADFFGVTPRTIAGWKTSKPEFLQALKIGKDAADARVEASLYHKAIGYTFDSVKIFQHQGTIIQAPFREHVAPDTTAAIFWLKNRMPEKWRDRQTTILEGGDKPVEVAISPLEAARKVAFAMRLGIEAMNTKTEE